MPTLEELNAQLLSLQQEKATTEEAAKKAQEIGRLRLQIKRMKFDSQHKLLAAGMDTLGAVLGGLGKKMIEGVKEDIKAKDAERAKASKEVKP